MSMSYPRCQCMTQDVSVWHKTPMYDPTRQGITQDVNVWPRRQCMTKYVNVWPKMSMYEPRCRCMTQDVDVWGKMSMYEARCRCMSQDVDVWAKMSMYEPRCRCLSQDVDVWAKMPLERPLRKKTICKMTKVNSHWAQTWRNPCCSLLSLSAGSNHWCNYDTRAGLSSSYQWQGQWRRGSMQRRVARRCRSWRRRSTCCNCWSRTCLDDSYQHTSGRPVSRTERCRECLNGTQNEGYRNVKRYQDGRLTRWVGDFILTI